MTSPNPPATGSPIVFPAGPPAPEREICGPLCHAPACLRFWHLASFDAPTVAAVWSLAFAWMVHKRLPLWVLALQVLVVWTVYVGDRLLDARTGLRRWGSELRERHYFHWRHRRLLAALAAGTAIAAAAIALHWMPFVIGERDSLLAVASLVYFTRVHSGGLIDTAAPKAGKTRRLLSKEMLVGVLFTIGCALPACSHAYWRMLIVPVVFFAALAWLNCRAIEHWESGRQGVASAARWTAVAGALTGLLLAFVDPRAALLLGAGTASALLLIWLDRARDRMTPVTVRAAADLVLLTPALLLCASSVVRL